MVRHCFTAGGGLPFHGEQQQEEVKRNSDLGSTPARGIVLDKERLQHLYGGRLCWILRKVPTAYRGRIGLGAPRCNKMSGEARIVNCFLLAEMNMKTHFYWRVKGGSFRRSLALHGMRFSDIKRCVGNKVYAWVVVDVREYAEPKSGRGLYR